RVRRLGRILRWSLAAILLVMGVAIATVLVVIQTRQAHELVRAKVVDLLTNTYRGRVAIGAIEGSFFGNLEIHDVVVFQNDEPIVTVPITKIRFAVLPLISGWIRLAEIDVTQPRVKLAKTDDGKWNVAAAFTSR